MYDQGQNKPSDNITAGDADDCVGKASHAGEQQVQLNERQMLPPKKGDKE